MDEQFLNALMKFAKSHPEDFDQALEGNFVQLNKMAAARRQLNTAVWLWFKKGDAASIHTLAGAAFGVLRDLYFRRFKRQPTPFDDAHMGDELREFAKQLRKLMWQTEWFLKHARKDPDEVHTIPTLWTEHYLFNAIKAYVELKGQCDQPLMSLFVMRYRAVHPGIFRGNPEGIPSFRKGPQLEDVQHLSHVEFFEQFGGQYRFQPPEMD